MTFDLRAGDIVRSDAHSRRESREQAAERLEALHRIVTGQPLTRKELNSAGFFIAVWFLMDVVQWLDWLIGKLQ